MQGNCIKTFILLNIRRRFQGFELPGSHGWNTPPGILVGFGYRDCCASVVDIEHPDRFNYPGVCFTQLCIYKTTFYIDLYFHLNLAPL